MPNLLLSSIFCLARYAVLCYNFQGGEFVESIGKKTAQRIPALDFLRGAAVILMVLYHIVFIFGEYFGFSGFRSLFLSIERFAPPFIATLFISVSAVSSHLSKNNIKRGIKLLCVALLISFVSIILLPRIGINDLGIKFGILHFLSIAMLLSPLLISLVKKMPAYIGIPVSVILFAFTANIKRRYLGFEGILEVRLPEIILNIKYLFPLGICYKGFSSADYYPLLPWIFIYIIGLWLAKAVFSCELSERSYKSLFWPLEFIGRHALIIYLVHMIVIYFIGYIYNSAITVIKI